MKQEKSKLPIKQQLFIKEYLVDLNGTQAAIRAGYSEKTANEQSARLLAKVSIKEQVQIEMDKRSQRTAINADYVLTTIQDTIERCKQAEPVYEMVDGEKVPTGEYKFEHVGVLRGCELLGKHLKLFTDKVEIGVTDSLAERLQRAKGKTEIE